VLNFFDSLTRDIPSQFNGKPNLTVYHRALARQLDELRLFYVLLEVLRGLQRAEGAQLDGIGDIVVLSRRDAFALSHIANQDVPMTDETYRLYLAWKIALNTTDCTQKDVYGALKMFWQTSPLYYSEDVNYPATIIFTTPALSPEDNAALLLTAPKVKAAGVALRVVANTETAFDHTAYMGGFAWHISTLHITEEATP